MIGLLDIEKAADRLSNVAVRTPLLSNQELDAAAGGTVLVKPECLQVTGSFKIRGAYNFLSQLSPDEAARGVVAFSSGNHAQGVAAADFDNAFNSFAVVTKTNRSKRVGELYGIIGVPALIINGK